METVQVGDMARELGVIRDASIVTALVSLLSIVPVLLWNARNVELLDILLHAAEAGILKTHKKDTRKEMKAEKRKFIK